MEMVITEEGHMEVQEIPGFLAQVLQELPDLAEGETRSSSAEERLFPTPISNDENQEIAEDWKAFVEPELHSLFQSARSTVEADLRKMEETPEGFRFEISQRHADAWLSVLGQARLSIAAEHRLTEKELSEDRLQMVVDERSQALARNTLFAHMQQYLVEWVTMEDEEC